MAFFWPCLSRGRIEVFHLRPTLQFILDWAESGGATGEAKRFSAAGVGTEY
jgi:hypothetical protein